MCNNKTSIITIFFLIIMHPLYLFLVYFIQKLLSTEAVRSLPGQPIFNKYMSRYLKPNSNKIQLTLFISGISPTTASKSTSFIDIIIRVVAQSGFRFASVAIGLTPISGRTQTGTWPGAGRVLRVTTCGRPQNYSVL